MKAALRNLLLAVLLISATRADAREYHGEIVRIIDGDTIVVNVTLGFGVELRLQSLRISNIQAPERGTDEGDASRKALIEMSGKKCVIQTGTHERDQYGRILATVVVAEQDLGEWQIAAGRAKPWSSR